MCGGCILFKLWTEKIENHRGMSAVISDEIIKKEHEPENV